MCRVREIQKSAIGRILRAKRESLRISQEALAERADVDRSYNLGWGHHHCNVVVKDSGIVETLEWMREVLNRNIQDGHLPAVKRAS